MAVWMPKRTQTGLCFHPRNLEIMEAGRPPGSSVAAGSLTGLCQTSPVIGFLVPPLRPQHPGIYLVLFLDTMNAPPFPFFGFFTLRGGRLWEQPSSAHSGVLWGPRQDIRYRKSYCPSAPSPLAGGLTAFQLPRDSVPCLCLWGRRGHHLLGSPSPFGSQSRASDGACEWLSGKVRRGIVPACCVVSWQRGVYPAVVVVVGELQKQCLQSYPMPASCRLSEEAAFLLINLCSLLSGVSYSRNHVAQRESL